MSDFSIAIERDDKNSHAYFNRGVLKARSGEPAAAIEDFDAAIKLDPDYAEAFNNRGVAREQLGRQDLALADYNKAIELRSRYPGALTNRALLRQIEGDYSAAVDDYGRALRMAPDSHPTLNDLAWLLATCPDEDIRNAEAALKYAQRANELTSNQEADYLDTLAAAQAANGDYDGAVESMQAAIKLAPPETQAELQERLELYRSEQPYVEEPSIADQEGPAKADSQAEPTKESKKAGK